MVGNIIVIIIIIFAGKVFETIMQLFEISVPRSHNLSQRCYGQGNYARYATQQTTFVSFLKTFPVTIVIIGQNDGSCCYKCPPSYFFLMFKNVWENIRLTSTSFLCSFCNSWICFWYSLPICFFSFSFSSSKSCPVQNTFKENTEWLKKPTNVYPPVLSILCITNSMIFHSLVATENKYSFYVMLSQMYPFLWDTLYNIHFKN